MIYRNYSHDKITKTWIKMSRQNWNGFSSNISHQMMIYLTPIVSIDKKPSNVNTKISRNSIKFMTWDLSNFDKTMIRWSDAHFVSFLFYYYCKGIKGPKIVFKCHVKNVITMKMGSLISCDKRKMFSKNEVWHCTFNIIYPIKNVEKNDIIVAFYLATLIL